jgi:squalene-associated FAD-dependent desaturase
LADDVAAPETSAAPGMANQAGKRPRAAIVGGGVAGLAAAVRCLHHGITPIVLEKRGVLGGRAFSFIDRETNTEIDNDQHVYVGACTAYRAFLKEIGADTAAFEQTRLKVPVLKDGEISTLGWSRISVLGMLPSLLRYRHLSWGGKLRAIYGMVRIKFTRRKPALDEVVFGDWLRDRGQNDETIEQLWNLIVSPTLNDEVSEVSADMGVMLFQKLLLGSRDDAIIGYSRVPLSQLSGDHAAGHITSNGGLVKLNASVDWIDWDDCFHPGVLLTDGSVIQADAVITAVPQTALPSLLASAENTSVSEPIAIQASGLETGPIVGVHIWYDRRVLDHDFIAVAASPLQFVFNVSAIHRGESEGDHRGQHILISLSSAYRWARLGRTELAEIFVAEMAKAFPAARNAEVIRVLTVKQPNATFRVTPGSGKYRPEQKTGVPSLFIAGDWTDTDWPSTMESAVRSGNLAADAAAEYLSS